MSVQFKTNESNPSGGRIVLQALMLVVIFGAIGAIAAVVDNAYGSVAGYALIGVCVGLVLAMANTLRLML